VHVAEEGNAGVVHLNFPFREPLVPDFTLNDLWKAPIDITYHPVYEGIKRIPDDQLTRPIEKLRTKQSAVLVCGPLMEMNIAEAVTQMAQAWGIHILADPLSQIRSDDHPKDHIIEYHDHSLHDETILELLQP